MRLRMMISFSLMLNSDVVTRRGGSVDSDTSGVEGKGEEAQQVQRVELAVGVGEGGNIWLEYKLSD